MHPAEERQQMMLAQAKELDILHHDHLVVLHGKQRTINEFLNIYFVTTSEKPKCPRYAFGCTHEPLALRIFDKPCEQISDNRLK